VEVTSQSNEAVGTINTRQTDSFVVIEWLVKLGIR
jgi:hypothetical protein